MNEPKPVDETALRIILDVGERLLAALREEQRIWKPTRKTSVKFSRTWRLCPALERPSMNAPRGTARWWRITGFRMCRFVIGLRKANTGIAGIGLRWQRDRRR